MKETTMRDRKLAPWQILTMAVAIGVILGGCATRTIPQPAVPAGVQVAPDSKRVDLKVPTFSHPTEITNPLFPVSRQASVLMLGEVEGKPFRTEVTLLTETRIIEWEGQKVEVAVSQYSAYLGGKITEVALDLYAQDDDGAVWYFGEDVFDFRDGAIVVTEGTWLAGRDGPAAMIMPAHAKVGDVYRTENAPGFVFEQVTVAKVGQTLDGPLGPIEGGLTADELHSDGSHEQKVFAPGYGEFYTSGGGDVEALAMAVPTDAIEGQVPADLATLSEEAMSAVEATRSGGWADASAASASISDAWQSYRTGEVPRLIDALMTDAIAALGTAVEARDPGAAGKAIQVARLALDLQLRYRPVVEVDLDRLDLWAAELIMDVAAEDEAAFRADAFAMDYVRDRIVHALSDADRATVNIELGEIQVAVADGEMQAGAEAAGRLRDALAGIQAAT
jgi:hypothetical protein